MGILTLSALLNTLKIPVNGYGVCLISISHGRYLKEAERYYDKCQYKQALQACAKEAGTWYHLLSYNSHERTAMYLMAESYCQLEDFDSACDTYKLMIDRYAGEYYGGRSQESLRGLKRGLEVVAYYPDHIAEGRLPIFIKDEAAAAMDPKQIEVMILSEIALKYMYDLKCHKKAHEVYTRIIGMDISDEIRKSAMGQIMNLKVAVDN